MEDKFCKDCKYVGEMYDRRIEPYCNHPKSAYKMRTGDLVWGYTDNILYTNCHTMREHAKLCTAKGVLWEPK